LPEVVAMETRVLFHITPKAVWENALKAGVYRARSLDNEGFIHCSKASQVTNVASRLFRAQKGLVLLCIDSTKILSPLKYEQIPGGEFYPHIYGPINLDAVVKVLDFPPRPDGSFDLPKSLYGKTNR